MLSIFRCSTSCEVGKHRLVTFEARSGILIEIVTSLYTGKRIVLASASPRRLEILKTFGLQPEVVPSTFPEELSHADYDDASQYCVATCSAKVSVKVTAFRLETDHGKSCS